MLSIRSTQSLKVGNDQKVDIAQRVRIPSRHASEKKNFDRMKFFTNSLD